MLKSILAVLTFCCTEKPDISFIRPQRPAQRPTEIAQHYQQEPETPITTSKDQSFEALIGDNTQIHDSTVQGNVDQRAFIILQSTINTKRSPESK